MIMMTKVQVSSQLELVANVSVPSVVATELAMSAMHH